MKIDAREPFKNHCNCRRGRNAEDKYCDGYVGAMARFIDDGNSKDFTGGLGNSQNQV